MKRLTDGLLRLNPAADDNPKLADFHQSLIYLVNHDDTGAIGVNLARLYPTQVRQLAAEQPELAAISSQNLLVPNLLCGGPLQLDMIWILRRSQSNYHKAIANEQLTLCFSSDGFQNINAPALVGIGCTSWSAGQLERELAQGLWLHYPSDQELLSSIPFSDPPLFSIHQFLKLRFGIPVLDP